MDLIFVTPVQELLPGACDYYDRLMTVRPDDLVITICFSRYTAQIAEGAARAVEEVKHAGLAGLNKAVSFLGVKKTLNLLRGDLHNTVTDAKATIAKVEAVGEELRSVGGHLKQAGRATVGKERQEVDASKEGRFQAGLLAPLRSFRDIVEHMEQSAGKAVGQLEKLEQAAARKPSVLDNLKKAEKPEKAAPAPKRAEPEAAL